MSQIIDISSPVKNQKNRVLSRKTENKLNEKDSYEDNLNYLRSKYEYQLFDMHTVAKELQVSYEFIRLAVQNNKIAYTTMGKRKMVHITEVARLITEGIK